MENVSRKDAKAQRQKAKTKILCELCVFVVKKRGLKQCHHDE